MALIGANQPETLIQGIGSFWNRQFKDTNMLERMYQGVEGDLAQTYMDLLASFLKLNIEDFPVFDKELWKFLDLSSADFTSAPGAYQVPAPDNFVSCRFLQNRILYPTVVYERGYDFVVTESDGEYTIIFLADPIGANGLPTYEDNDGNTHVGLWAQDAQVDNDSLYEQLGVLFSLKRPSSLSYKVILEGIWKFYMLGPNLEYVEAGLNVIAGLPVCATDGEVVQTIDTGAPGGVEVTTTSNTYLFPHGAPLKSSVAPNYVLTLFEPMTDAFLVADEKSDPGWWESAVIPTSMVPDQEMLIRRSRPVWYAPIYGPTEQINIWTDEQTHHAVDTISSTWTNNGTLSSFKNTGAPPCRIGIDKDTTGSSPDWEYHAITQVHATLLEVAPNLGADINGGGRFFLQYHNGSTWTAIPGMGTQGSPFTNGISLRSGGTRYGQLGETRYPQYQVAEGGTPSQHFTPNRYRNFAWNIWDIFLKNHVFLVVFNTQNLADLALTVEELEQIIIAAKPAYTDAFVTSSTELDELIDADDLISLMLRVGWAQGSSSAPDLTTPNFMWVRPPDPFMSTWPNNKGFPTLSSYVPDPSAVEIEAGHAPNNMLIFGGSSAPVGGPCLYYGMMSRDVNLGAEAGPPAVAPSWWGPYMPHYSVDPSLSGPFSLTAPFEPDIFSGTISAVSTELLAVTASQTLSPVPSSPVVGVGTPLAFEGWDILEASYLDSIADDASTNMALITTKTLTGFANNHRYGLWGPAPVIFREFNGPMSIEFKLDLADFLSVPFSYASPGEQRMLLVGAWQSTPTTAWRGNWIKFQNAEPASYPSGNVRAIPLTVLPTGGGHYEDSSPGQPAWVTIDTVANCIAGPVWVKMTRSSLTSNDFDPSTVYDTLVMEVKVGAGSYTTVHTFTGLNLTSFQFKAGISLELGLNYTAWVGKTGTPYTVGVHCTPASAPVVGESNVVIRHS